MHRGRIAVNPAAGMVAMFPPPPRRFNFNHMFPVQVVQPPPFTFHAAPLPPVQPELPVQVRPVWAGNFNEEWAYLQSFAACARYIAVDVHYPGVVHAADQDLSSLPVEHRYALMKANVDGLKPLQVGIAVCDHQGQQVAWEFNLRDFCRLADPHDAKALDYLARRGLDLDTLRNHGVDAYMLGALLMGSGLIGAGHGRPLSWVTHAGAYHVAYLLKIVTGGAPLPHDVAGFLGAMRYYLGQQVYDVATMAANCTGMPVGLDHIATNLRIHLPWGSPRLAGAAGVRALLAFRILKDGRFGGNVERFRGLLQGLQH
ncbi:probable CCR4-associated factor 1 homolog 11 [Triticum dicoccoides]|uniref:probable CCR4-associated factor 1 homolog 11 n=1 Tax=Triticum dicoccoides TaxID=85692 RepID=UPI00188FB3AA|nr:probable CCR4-associated factor 1 homolog 11 [Triticum dicoccoides]